MKKFKSINLYISTLLLSFSISFKASKSIMIFRLLALSIGSVLPIINMSSVKYILDGLSTKSYNLVYNGFVLLSICQILAAIVSKITGYLTNIHSDKISLIVSKEIIEKVNELDISYFDNPKLYDELGNITRDVNSIPSLIWNILFSIQTLIKFSSAFFILFSYSWWITIIVTISCLPNFIYDRKYSLEVYNWERETTNERRKMNYSYDSLTSKYIAKDIRINGLKEYLYDKYFSQWIVWYKKKRALIDKQFIVSFITMLFPHIITLIFAYILLNNIINGDNTIGDFSYYIGIMGQLTGTIFGLISGFADVIQKKVKIEYYNKFKKWNPLIKNSGKNVLNQITDRKSVV